MKRFNFQLLVFFTLCISNIYAQGLVSKVEAKIDQVQSQFGLSGEGVLTIMMDRGIDYIYDLYDNSGANDADNPFGVGTIYDNAEINAS